MTSKSYIENSDMAKEINKKSTHSSHLLTQK